MSGISILLLCAGILFCPVSFIIIMIRFFQLPDHLKDQAYATPKTVLGWLFGLAAIILSFLI